MRGHKRGDSSGKSSCDSRPIHRASRAAGVGPSGRAAAGTCGASARRCCSTAPRLPTAIVALASSARSYWAATATSAAAGSGGWAAAGRRASRRSAAVLATTVSNGSRCARTMQSSRRSRGRVSGSGARPAHAPCASHSGAPPARAALRRKAE
eukprot:scaffold34552_cov90-Isochrysis_galbana.AAC.1